MSHKFVITDACINCGACVDTCPVGAIEPKGTQHAIDSKCIQCGSCLGVCPVDAIHGVCDCAGCGEGTCPNRKK